MDTLIEMLVLLLVIRPFINCTIKWEISEFPVVFGRDVKLICNTSAVTVKGINSTRRRTWFGGPDHKILSVDGVSFDPSKYSAEIIHNGFSVIIKHLSIEDINHEYSCSYGFDEYSNSLSIDDNYESNPSDQKQELNYTLRHGILNVFILMKKVHPIPSCSICFKDTYLLSILPSKVQKEELFYNVEFNTSHKVKEPGCGAFDVLCIVGSTKYILSDTYICDTQGNNTDYTMKPPVERSNTLMILLFIVLVGSVLLGIVLLLLHFCCQCQNKSLDSDGIC